MTNSRKYHTCAEKTCGHYVFYKAGNQFCPKCATRYTDSDVSHWAGNTWLRSGNQPPSTPKDSPDKAESKGGNGKGSGKPAAGKGTGKGGGSADATCGKHVDGCSFTFLSDMADLGLDENDLPMVKHIDALDRAKMDTMADAPRHLGWKPLLQRVCLRKFPIQDVEKSLDVRLDKARKAVTRSERARDTAAEARETAQAALDAAKLEETKAEDDLTKAKSERDACIFLQAKAANKRNCTLDGKKTAAAAEAPAPLPAEYSSVLETALNSEEQALLGLTAKRKTLDKDRVTILTTLKDLRESIPIDDHDDDGEAGQRERSPRRTQARNRLQEAEKKKAKIEADLTQCDASIDKCTRSLEKRRSAWATFQEEGACFTASMADTDL